MVSRVKRDKVGVNCMPIMMARMSGDRRVEVSGSVIARGIGSNFLWFSGRNRPVWMGVGSIDLFVEEDIATGDGTPHWPFHQMFFYADADLASWGRYISDGTSGNNKRGRAWRRATRAWVW